MVAVVRDVRNGLLAHAAPLTLKQLERCALQMRLVGSEVTKDLWSPLLNSLLKDGVLSPDEARFEVAKDLWDWCTLNQLPAWLRDLESQQRSKHGSYSKKVPYENGPLQRAVESYFVRHKAPVDSMIMAKAIKNVLSKLSREGMAKPSYWSLEQAANSLPQKSSSGFPFFSSDPGVYFSTCLSLSSRVLAGDEDMMRYPYTLGFRGQPVGTGQPAKCRPIFQGSRVVTNLEKMVQGPVLSHLQDLPCFAAWCGPTQVDREVTRIFNDDDRNGVILSIDYSAFDSSVPGVLIDAAFSVLRELVDDRSQPFLLERLKVHFKCSGLIAPDGYYYNRRDGIPSGSGFTNLVGSIINLLVIEAAAEALHFRVLHCLIQGDDGVFKLSKGREFPHIVEIAEWVQENLGMTLHPGKQFVGYKEIHFLQNVHRATYRVNGLAVGVRPLMRVLNGMMSYERFKPGWSGEADTIRWVQQIESAKHHPMFEIAVRWLATRDTYALSFTFPELVDRAGGTDKVEALLSSGFQGGKLPLEGLYQSKTVQILNNIRSGYAVLTGLAKDEVDVLVDPDLPVGVEDNSEIDLS